MAHNTLVARINAGNGKFPFVNVKFSKNHRPIPIEGATYYLRPSNGCIQPHEPAEQNVVVDLLYQHPLAAHRVLHLQQQSAQQLLRRNRWTTKIINRAKEPDSEPRP